MSYARQSATGSSSHIHYGDEQERRTERVVWPIQLGFMDQARVLCAWCELRQDFRTFRTDRIASR